MEGWKTTELQNAEREFEETEQEMLTEVSLSVPAISELVNVSVTPIGARLHFPENPSVSLPHFIGISADTELREM